MDMSALEVRRRVMLAQPHEAVASGAVASFRTDVVSPLPMEFDLVPVQDLHGQANPYPPGGGKNLIPPINTQPASGEVIVEYPLEKTLNGFSIKMKFSGSFVNAGASFIDLQDADGNHGYITPAAFGLAAGTTYTKQAVSFSSIEIKKIKKIVYYRYPNFTNPVFDDLMLEQGSTPTTYAPYSNICPITGHDGFTRNRTGVNVWDEEWEVGGLVNATGLPYNATDRIRSKHFSPCKPNTTYYKASVGIHTNLFWYDTDMAFIERDLTTANSVVTSPSNAAFFKLVNTDVTTYKNDISINYPSTDHNYHAYTGTSYTTTFPTPPGTIYGCHVRDNGDGTYDLTVDRARFVIDGTGTFGNYESTTEYAHITMASPSQSRKNQGAIQCDILPQNGSKPYANTGMGVWQGASLAWYICINKALLDADNKESFVAWLASNQPNCIYYLDTPVTYTLSLTALQSLIGQNHIWVDNADSVSVEYWGH